MKTPLRTIRPWQRKVRTNAVELTEDRVQEQTQQILETKATELEIGVGNLTPGFRIAWRGHHFIQILVNDRLAHFTDEDRDCAGWNAPPKLRSTGQMSQCQRQFQARFERLAVESVLLRQSASDTLNDLIKHFRWHAHEVREKTGVIPAKLNHKLVVQSKLLAPQYQ